MKELGKKRRKMRSLREWQKIFKLWEGSGLSKARYCKDHHIAPGPFHLWYQRLHGIQSEVKAAESLSSLSSFIPVQIEGSPNLVGSQVDVTLKGGHCLRIHAPWREIRDLLVSVLSCS